MLGDVLSNMLCDVQKLQMYLLSEHMHKVTSFQATRDCYTVDA